MVFFGLLLAYRLGVWYNFKQSKKVWEEVQMHKNTGEIAGTFGSTECPSMLQIKYRYNNQSVVVDYMNGLRVLIR